MSFNVSIDQIVTNNANGLLLTHPSWQRVQLQEVAKILNGFPFPSQKFRTDGSGIPLLRIRDIFNTNTEASYSGDFDPAYLVQSGDLVVGMDGDFNSSLWRGPSALLNQRVCKITPDPTFYSKKFLSYVLPGYLSTINAHTSSITVKHLSSRTIAEIPLPLPPLAEQERIVGELDKHVTRLDTAVSALKKSRRNLRNYYRSILKAACEGQLVPTEAELARAEGRGYEPTNELRSANQPNMPLLPEGWYWARFEQLFFSLRNGLSIKPNADDGTPILRISAVRSMRIDFSDVRYVRAGTPGLNEALLKDGDLLFTRYNGNPDLVGVCGMVCNISGPTAHPDKLIRARILDDICLPGFLEVVLNAGLSRRHLSERVRTTAGQAGISGGDLKSMPVPVAPLREQKRIADEVHRRLSFIQNLTSAVEDNLRRAESLRRAILESAFSGRLAPQDLADEPASALLDRIREARHVAEPTGRRRANGASPGRRREVSEHLEEVPACSLGREPQEPAPNPTFISPEGAQAYTGRLPAPLRGSVREGGASDPGAYAPGYMPAALRASQRGDEAHTQPPADTPPFIDLAPLERAELAWRALLHRGGFPRDEAIREIADSLRQRGLARFQRLRQGGPLYEAISSAIDRGLRQGLFDRPGRGHVRAILPDPKAYSPDDWRLCLLGALDSEAVDEEDALRAAAEWAGEALGLQFERLRADGVILKGLRAALEEAIRRGEVVRVGRGRVRKAGEPGRGQAPPLL